LVGSGLAEQLIELDARVSSSGDAVSVIGRRDDGSDPPVVRLVGRTREAKAIAGLLDGVPDQGGALVVRGETGIGKSALLESAISSASGFRVVRTSGVESDMELAFAALQQLCAPLLDRLGRLPGPQREALRVAFGLSAGHSPDRFLVGIAVLSLFSEVTEQQPLLCVVDDAQWLDQASAQVLAFVARRLSVKPVALVFATRDPGGQLEGLPELVVEGLRNGDAHALLGSVWGVPLDERVRQRIVAETRGNPLALLELPRGLTPAQLAGGFGLLDAPGLSGRIEESFRRRLEGLPADTQRLLLVAAAEPVGDPVLLWRAARRLEIGFQAAADTDGLLVIGASVTFRHPLVRTAAYRAASPEERQAVHRALAGATDAELDPDRRAWHLAHATPGFDEDVASELERSAGRAQARGGLAAAAAFLERSAALTFEPTRRAQRALAAAQANLQAGALDAALRLLGTADAVPLDELALARIDLVRAQIAFASKHGSDAPPLLLKAAKRLTGLDPELARETYRDAFCAAVHVARLNAGVGVLEVAAAARSAPPAAAPARPSELLLDGLVALITDGYAVGAPTLRRAVRGLRDQEISAEEGLRWLPLACKMAHDVCDDESWYVLSGRLIELAREVGALSVLPFGLSLRFAIELFGGEFALAESLAEEADAVSELTHTDLAPYGALLLSAWRGREHETLRLIEAVTEGIVARGEGTWITATHWATAVLYNGLGRFEEARVAAEQAREYPHELGISNWALVEHVEAAARSGNTACAAESVQHLTEIARATGTDWALGNEAYARALLSDGETAEGLYREAIERFGRSRIRVQFARTHLLFGEWLRRERRRLDAREQLRHAHELFTEFGMEAFAERARVELEATGEHARKRTVETRDDLTPQEAQISRLAAEGATNQEIAAQLFIRPSTVDYHLRKAFRKLGVKSRHQLKQHQLRPPAQVDPAGRGTQGRTRRRPHLRVPVGDVARIAL
jgi:DNA-binding CsgD family transcriptional regulator